jgi:hypothetical protein
MHRAAAAAECERNAENALVEAKARYLGWTTTKDERFSFRKAVLGTREEHRKQYNKFGQSSESCPARKPTTLAAMLLKEQCSDLYNTRSAFKDHLAGDVDVRF